MLSPLWRKGLLVLLVIVCPVALMIALAIVFFIPWGKDRPVPQPEERSDAVMPSEYAVKRYVLQQAADAHSVQFQRWGPHDLTGALVHHRRAADNRIIRLRYREVNRRGEEQIQDNLYYVLDGEVLQVIGNAWGDDWESAIRRLNEAKPAVQEAGGDR